MGGGCGGEARVDAVARVHAVRQKRAHRREQADNEKHAVKQALSGQTILIRASANEEGHLFGGVGPKEIAEAIAKRKKLVLDPRAIKLVHHLKVLGSHEVVVDLGGGETITITVNIERNE